MEEADRYCLRQLIEKAIEECNDIDTLDLVYKILIAGDIR